MLKDWSYESSDPLQSESNVSKKFAILLPLLLLILLLIEILYVFLILD